jgi:hypothetical protein
LNRNIYIFSGLGADEKVFQRLDGTKDHILPFRYITCDHIVKDGGHYLTLNCADEISQALRSIIL